MILALGYKKRTGKDTFYETIKERFPQYNVHRVAFADSLKDEVYELLLKHDNLDKSILDDPITKPIMRPFLQWFGTEYRRNPVLGGDPDYWIKKAVQKILTLKQSDPDCVIVICDARFPNELIALKKIGATAIRIQRDSVFDPNEQHSSEIALDEHLNLFDHHINNDGTLAQYKDKVQDFFNGAFEKI